MANLLSELVGRGLPFEPIDRYIRTGAGKREHHCPADTLLCPRHERTFVRQLQVQHG